MTKTELALILKIIDAHTTKHTYNYGAPDSYTIYEVGKLKEDIITHYEEVMKNADN